MKIRKYRIQLSIVLLAFSNFAYSVPTWQIDGSGKYTGATGIDINGSSYDVTLFGSSWDDAVAAFDPDPIYSFAFATAARDAFHNLVFDPNNADSVNFAADPSLSAVATPIAPNKVSFATVYAVDNFYTYAAMSCIGEFFPGVCTSSITFNGISHNRNPNDPTYNPAYDHYLVWNPSDLTNIPVPSAILLMTTGLAALGFANRKKKHF